MCGSAAALRSAIQTLATVSRGVRRPRKRQLDRRLLGDVALQPQHQHGVVRDLRRLLAEAEQAAKKSRKTDRKTSTTPVTRPMKELCHSYFDGNVARITGLRLF